MGFLSGARTVRNRRIFFPFFYALARFAVLLAGGILLGASAPTAADLSFEQRVRAQEAIQRVYYSHQLNATLPFNEAYPREVLEGQVRDYLSKSAALEHYWKAPVTQAALRAELERIARNSRLPDRLEEIYAALDNDSLLIEECFARPSLVDRLVQHFFAADERVHAAERGQAEALRDRLVQGVLSPEAADSHRSVLETRAEVTSEGTTSEVSQAREAHITPDGPRILSREEFQRWRLGLPARVGEIGPLLDQDGAFRFHVVLWEKEDQTRIASYAVAKRSWSVWWEENRGRYSLDTIMTVAQQGDRLPAVTSPGAGNGAPFPQIAAREGTLAADCVQGHWDNGSLDDLPTPRGFHTAVWTGSQMIVWGGADTASGGIQGVNSGARYDPLTDTWSPTSTINAPQGRAWHVAVWTGSEMIVWGGTTIYGNSSFMINTGGRYNPATDTWVPTTLNGAPPGVYRASVIWTGTEMIVWGGWTKPAFRHASGGDMCRLRTAGLFSPRRHRRAVTVVTIIRRCGRERRCWSGAAMTLRL